MAFIYLAGLSANLCTSDGGGSLGATSQDVNFPPANMGLGIPAKPFKFNTAALDDNITNDLGSAKQPDFVSIHGHNIDTGVTSIDVESDDNNTFTSPVTEATIASADIVSPTFYTTIASPTSHRYWRLVFNGTNGNPIEIGEWGLGIQSTLTNAQLASWSMDFIQPQNRQTGANVPQVFANNLTDLHQRSVTLTFVATSYTERNELRDMLVDSKFGEEPLIFVPDDSDEIVIHGRVPNGVSWERVPGPSGGYHRVQMTIDEDPFSIALT